MFDLLSSQSSQLYSFSFWNIKACILAKCYFPLKIFSLNNIICVFLKSLLRLIQTQQILQNINSGCCLFGKFTFLPLDKLNIWEEIKQYEWQWKACHKEKKKKNHSMQRRHLYCYILANHSFKQLKFLIVSV